ncbi:hypothetical protein ACFL1B_02730 [Nanoarchaeota archaeon]
MGLKTNVLLTVAGTTTLGGAANVDYTRMFDPVYEALERRAEQFEGQDDGISEGIYFATQSEMDEMKEDAFIEGAGTGAGVGLAALTVLISGYVLVWKKEDVQV